MRPYYETELGKLYHGDCLEIMPELEPVDLVLTDPPYGLGEKLRGGKTGMMDGCFNKMVDDLSPEQVYSLLYPIKSKI